MKPWIVIKLVLSNGLEGRRQGVGQGLQLAIVDFVPFHLQEMNIATSRCPAPISIVKNVRLRSSLISSENVAKEAVNLGITTMNSLRDHNMTMNELTGQIALKGFLLLF